MSSDNAKGSGIGAALVARESGRLGELMLDEGAVYWIERRPHEGGRNALVRWRTGDGRRDLIGAPFNARTRAHEYGGGSYLVSGGDAWFSQFDDSRLYTISGSVPHALTPPEQGSFADLILDAPRRRLIAVREESRADAEPRASLVGIDIERAGTAVQTLVAGDDFYSNPRLSPDGEHLAWLSWSHPNMPWDGTTLWLACIGRDGTIQDRRAVAGGASESVFQPEWSPDGVLHWVSDRTGWWNLYRLESEQARALAPMAAEFGLPQWVFRMSTYAFRDASTIVCAYTQSGLWSLATLDTNSGQLREVALPYTYLDSVCASPRHAYFVGASPTQAASIIQLDLDSLAHRAIASAGQIPSDLDQVATGEPIEFATADGAAAHAFFYRPTGRQAGAGRVPPLLVKSHGGPTACANNAFDIAVQFWTSRGFAVVDVNYGGSTGFGREYRGRLDGKWGVVDVDDCCRAALHLAEQGAADPDRLAIRGGSAGGYTTLAALAFRDTFHAGASHYGIGDLEALVRDTHKFESRYLDRLVGPYPAQRELYLERSPIHFADRLSCPIIFFQGLDDLIVPPNQAQTMAAALSSKGVPVAVVTFEGEGHGFRRAESITRSLEAELYFYSRVFGFELEEDIPAIEIDNY